MTILVRDELQYVKVLTLKNKEKKHTILLLFTFIYFIER